MKKEVLINLINKTCNDSKFWVRIFTGVGDNFKSEKKSKPFLLSELEKADEIKAHHLFEDVLVISKHLGLYSSEISKNIEYSTTETEGFFKHTDMRCPNHHVFIRLDKENKTIEFKLGEKYKKLELIENTDWVCKPYRQKFLKCVSVDKLEEHIHDEFWNPAMVRIGRRVLKLETVL